MTPPKGEMDSLIFDSSSFLGDDGSGGEEGIWGGGGLRGEEPRKLQLLNLRELLGDSALHFNLVFFYMMHKL